MRAIPTFEIKLSVAGHEQGIINIPVSFDEYFTNHGDSAEVILPNGQKIFCTIERKNTPNNVARISSVQIQEFFASRYHKGDVFIAKLNGQNKIKLMVKV